MWYHATPFSLTTLNPDSWVSNSKLESCLHLLMKNIKEGRGRLDGYLITIDDSAVTSTFDIDERIRFGQTKTEIPVEPTRVERVRDVVKTFPENQQWVFHATDVVDLIPYLN